MLLAGGVTNRVGKALVVMGVAAAAATMSACQGDPKAEAPPVTIAPDDMIDDFEDGDDSILIRGGRSGPWYTYHEPITLGTLEPADGTDLKGVGGVMTVKASGWREYVGFGFQFSKEPMATQPKPYDISAYKGIAFKARGTGIMTAGIAMREVLPPSEGGTCVEAPAPPLVCHDVHRVTFSLTSDWKQKQIPFAQMRQDGWGVKAVFVPTAVIAFQFDSVEAGSFEISIDEIGLYK